MQAYVKHSFITPIIDGCGWKWIKKGIEHYNNEYRTRYLVRHYNLRINSRQQRGVNISWFVNSSLSLMTLFDRESSRTFSARCWRKLSDVGFPEPRTWCFSQLGSGNNAATSLAVSEALLNTTGPWSSWRIKAHFSVAWGAPGHMVTTTHTS